MQLPIVMFAASENPTNVARSYALGAAAYLLKSSGRQQIIKAIRTAGDGKALWTKDQLSLIDDGLGEAAVTDRNIKFTKREGDVLKLVALGLSNKEIAYQL